MIVMVSGATKTIRQYADSQNLGCLLTPRSRNSFESMCGLPWAADNDAFNGFEEARFLTMLERIRGTNPIFVTSPDVVSDSRATMELFFYWEPIIHAHSLPVALVLQEGQESLDMPWSRLEAIFVGGSTEYKLGPEVRWLVREAKWRKKWVHMGRVNSYRRLQYARAIGCDSIDGSGYSRFPETYLPGVLKFLRHEQMTLPLDELFEESW